MKSCNKKYLSIHNHFISNVLLFFACFFISIKGTYSIKELKEKPQVLTEIVATLLTQQGYSITTDIMEIHNKPNLIIIIANTSDGKKFLKLHENGSGIREYNGGKIISKHLPTITSECVICKDNLELIVQPYLEEVENHTLFDIIENQNAKEDSVLSLMISIINHISTLVNKTLEYNIKPTLNDYLYNHRLKTKAKDGESGRLELFYVQQKLNLAGVEIEWEQLLFKNLLLMALNTKKHCMTY